LIVYRGKYARRDVREEEENLMEIEGEWGSCRGISRRRSGEGILSGSLERFGSIESRKFGRRFRGFRQFSENSGNVLLFDSFALNHSTNI
jgi:alpha-galactosidase